VKYFIQRVGVALLTIVLVTISGLTGKSVAATNIGMTQAKAAVDKWVSFTGSASAWGVNPL